MRNRLRKLLENHRYESSMGLGQRKLMPHHIEALFQDLAPFIEEETRMAMRYSSGDSLETIGWLGGSDS